MRVLGKVYPLIKDGYKQLNSLTYFGKPSNKTHYY